MCTISHQYHFKQLIIIVLASKSDDLIWPGGKRKLVSWCVVRKSANTNANVSFNLPLSIHGWLNFIVLSTYSFNFCAHHWLLKFEVFSFKVPSISTTVFLYFFPEKTWVFPSVIVSLICRYKYKKQLSSSGELCVKTAQWCNKDSSMLLLTEVLFTCTQAFLCAAFCLMM